MSISSYSDHWFNGNNIEFITDYYDNSSGCNHWNYGVNQTVWGASGVLSQFSDYGPTGFNSFPFVEGELNVESSLAIECSCWGGWYSPAVIVNLNLYASIKHTYFTNGTQIYGPSGSPIACYYEDLACVGGTPTCPGGIMFAWSGKCTEFAKTEWLVVHSSLRPLGVCTVGWNGPANFPGTCT